GAVAPTDAWFQEEVVKVNEPVLVEFMAPWCGFCRLMERDLAKLEKAMPGKFKLVQIDGEERPELAQHYEVEGYPVLFVMSGGKVIAKQEGVSGSSPEETYAQLKAFVGDSLSDLSQ